VQHAELHPPTGIRRPPHGFVSAVHLLAVAGLATATTSATFLPQCERRIRCASAASVTDLPAIRASASGSMWRDAPHGQVTRTKKSPKQSSSRLM
jgi:hypothetical protein